MKGKYRVEDLKNEIKSNQMKSNQINIIIN